MMTTVGGEAGVATVGDVGMACLAKSFSTPFRMSEESAPVGVAEVGEAEEEEEEDVMAG
jgi:hypothetical protein